MLTSAVTLLPDAIAEVAAAIRRGEIVAFPTETYYGLAVDALDPAAVDRLFALKGRGVEKASALLVADMVMFAELCAEVPARARELAAAHWPGPLTIVLPARDGLPAAIVSEGCVAGRVSSHPLAHALVAAVGRPITCTSANPSGMPPPRTAEEVAAGFRLSALRGEGRGEGYLDPPLPAKRGEGRGEGHLDPPLPAKRGEGRGEGHLYILDAGPTPGGSPSTLVRLRGSHFEVLRPGAVQL